MTNLPTKCAPAERAPLEAIQALAEQFCNSPAAATLDALPWAVLILNPARQIVFCNQAFDALSRDPDESNLAARPGEALGCLNAGMEAGGCGTSEFCRYCGALHAILRAGSEPAVRECRLQRVGSNGGEESMDLRVTARNYAFDHNPLVLVAVQDISFEKRLEAMERIFLHDIMNSASNLDGLSQLLEEEVDESGLEYVDMLRLTARRITEEIGAQRDLRAAERGELAPSQAPLTPDNALERTWTYFAGHELLQDCELVVASCSNDVFIETDPVILGRVLGNMVKNALEAVRAGERVTMGCRVLEDAVEFFVHNPGAMDEQARLEVFKRSFSTKGPGRGLGTYSMKLLTERYLRGAVDFTTSQEHGTTFYVRLPLPKKSGEPS
jgi:signal transduction histidine kinase